VNAPVLPGRPAAQVAIPGGVTASAVDADGVAHPVTPEVWRHLTVASFLRHQLYDPEMTAGVPALHRCALGGWVFLGQDGLALQCRLVAGVETG
jgi:hypothetical protein